MYLKLKLDKLHVVYQCNSTHTHTPHHAHKIDLILRPSHNVDCPNRMHAGTLLKKK